MSNVIISSKAVEKPTPLRLMENVHPAVPGGTKLGTHPEGVGTEPERSAGKEIPRNAAYAKGPRHKA